MHFNNIMSDRKLSSRESTLLGLIIASNIQKILYTDDIPNKEIRKRLKKRVKENELSNDVSKSIEEVQSAIAGATASYVAITSSGS